jgi:hypothetical protein
MEIVSNEGFLCKKTLFAKNKWQNVWWLKIFDVLLHRN